MWTSVSPWYPATTTFYRAVVVQQARRQASGEYGDFLLEFEDDGDADGLPQRPVRPARYWPPRHRHEFGTLVS